MKLGRGLDIGTMNLVAGKQTEQGIEYTRMRDCFISVPAKAKKMMKLSDVDYIEMNDHLLIVGDNALEMCRSTSGYVEASTDGETSQKNRQHAKVRRSDDFLTLDQHISKGLQRVRTHESGVWRKTWDRI